VSEMIIKRVLMLDWVEAIVVCPVAERLCLALYILLNSKIAARIVGFPMSVGGCFNYRMPVRRFTAAAYATVLPKRTKNE